MKIKLVLFIVLSSIIVYSCSKDDGGNRPINNSPIIQNISASPPTLSVDSTTILKCLAIDSDGDSLNYSWDSNNGTFPNGNTGSSILWKAPSAEGLYIIYVIVNDGENEAYDSIEVSVKKHICGNSIVYDDKIYNTVRIGDQCWLKENLNIGTMIQSTAGGQLQTENGIIEKYCFDNDENNCDIYGGLYEWNEAMQYVEQEREKGICPEGWHIPTYSELQILSSTVEGNGNSLKREDQGSGIGQGTNSSGFSAIFAGSRDNVSGNFYIVGNANIWSSTKRDSLNAYNLYLRSKFKNVFFIHSNHNFGFSIRCIKD